MIKVSSYRHISAFVNEIELKKRSMFTWSSIDDQQYIQPKIQANNVHYFEEMIIFFLTSLNSNNGRDTKWKSSENNFILLAQLSEGKWGNNGFIFPLLALSVSLVFTFFSLSALCPFFSHVKLFKRKKWKKLFTE